MPIELYDTTLRDGMQREGLWLSGADKMKLARRLDEFGVDYIEGGWPGSNPKDAEFFARIADAPLARARIAAFGSTRRAGIACEDDANLRALLAAGTPTVTLVGKSSLLHVTRVLETSPDENLRMIAESIAYCKAQGREVIFDAEHFFDAFRSDPAYASDALVAAAEAGADCIVLCDTNGGALPADVAAAVRAVCPNLRTRLGVHTHNDGGLALANALAAVEEGCTHVQGTINGYGERCGNLDLLQLAATAQLKLGRRCLGGGSLASLSALARFAATLANLNPDAHAPYVGASAFAHKGGLHVAAVAKIPEAYQHVDPALVGNESRTVVSELAGRGTVRARARALGLEVNGAEQLLLQRIKQLEEQGAQFEAADGSFELLVRRAAAGYQPPFRLLRYAVGIERDDGGRGTASATATVRVGGAETTAAARGVGPVDALDRAVRNALVRTYPALESITLADYKVRIIDGHRGTAARTRVLIDSVRGAERWSTMGVADDIIEASWLAIRDALELPLLRSAT